MGNFLRTLFLSLILASVFYTGAFATTINFDSSYNVVDGQQLYTFTDFLPGVDMTIESRREGEMLTWDSTDNGIGIIDDEITGGYTDWTDRETLRLTFSEEIFLSSLFIVDLFPNEGADGEYGAYKLDYYGDDQGFADFTEIIFGPGDSLGNLTVDINQTVIAINLFAVNDTIYDYALAGLEASAPVPEPSTFLLLGAGLSGLAIYRRKSKK